MTHYALASVALVGTFLNLLGALYLAYDLLDETTKYTKEKPENTKHTKKKTTETQRHREDSSSADAAAHDRDTDSAGPRSGGATASVRLCVSVSLWLIFFFPLPANSHDASPL